jgi:two-component system response regulator YesN
MTFIQVMLVDDEPLALANVYEMVDWEASGFEVVAKATNGRMALRLFERLRPQIVITDISMPKMDGLELGREIHRIEPKTHLVFLTAYRDFDYARQAIELKAANYLLKHEISHNRLQDQLLKLKKAIETDELERGQSHKRLLRDILQAKATLASSPGDSLQTKQADKRLQGQLALFYFELNPGFSVSGGKSLHAIVEAGTWPGIESRIAAEENAVEWIELIGMDEGGTAAVIKLNIPSSMLLEQYTLQSVARLIQKEVRGSCGYTPKIMMAASKARDQLPELYGKMKQEYDYSLFLPPNAIFSLEQASSSRQEGSASSQALQAYFRNSPADTPALRRLTEELISHRDLSALRELIRLAGTQLQNSGLAHDSALGGDAAQIAAELYRLINEEAEARRERLQYSRWVVKAMDYVKEHYSDPEFSLEQVAEALQISSVHLRATFRKETGQSLLDYTTEYRIDMAKRLLIKGELKIYEISERVGYKTSQYFSQVFKKTTGKHPKDFMQPKGGE